MEIAFLAGRIVMGEMVSFMKDVALAASALMFLAIPQPWPFSLGG